MNLDQLIREADPARGLDIQTPDPPLVGRNRRSEQLRGLPALVIAVAVVALVALGAFAALHRGSPSAANQSQATGIQPLSRILGVLRHPQTKADLPPALVHWLKIDSSSPPERVLGTPDLADVRLATVTPKGEQVFLVPDKPATGAALSTFISKRRVQGTGASAYEQRLRALAEQGDSLRIVLINHQGRGHVTGVDTTQTIERGQGSAIFNRELLSTMSGELILVVPDGVAKVTALLHKGSRALTSVTGRVHNNVLAVRAPGAWYDEPVLKMTWYGPTGKVLKRFCEQCHFFHFVPKQPIKALSRAQARSFAILDRPRDSADALPAQFRSSHGPALERQNGVSFKLTRAAVTPGAKVWLMPGEGSMCVLAVAKSAQLGGVGCSSTAAAAAGGMTTGGSQGYPGQTFVSGIVRNGATSLTVRLRNGRQTTLPVVDNAYGAIVNGSPVSAVMHYSSGAAVPIQVP